MDEDFNTNVRGLHCLGDSSGWTRGLMMASVMGVLMGRAAGLSLSKKADAFSAKGEPLRSAHRRPQAPHPAARRRRQRHSLRCASSPHRTRFAGLRWGPHVADDSTLGSAQSVFPTPQRKQTCRRHVCSVGRSGCAARRGPLRLQLFFRRLRAAYPQGAGRIRMAAQLPTAARELCEAFLKHCGPPSEFVRRRALFHPSRRCHPPPAPHSMVLGDAPRRR